MPKVAGEGKKGRGVRPASVGAVGAGTEAKAWMRARLRESAYPYDDQRGSNTPRALAAGGLGLAFLGLVVWLGGFGGAIWAASSGAAERLVSDLGFKVRHIDVRGATRVDEAEVARRLMIEKGEVIFHLNPAEARRSVTGLAWVRDASVHRLLPDRIVVVIEERAPNAIEITANRRKIVLDDLGAPIPGADPRPYEGLIVVEGEGAAEASPELVTALERHPDLKPRVARFVRQGGRRWDAILQSRTRVQLPEGPAEAGLARLAAFAAEQDLMRINLETVDLRGGDIVLRNAPIVRERGA